MIEKIIRYKNNTLYSSLKKSFISYPDILARDEGSFFVQDAHTKEFVTTEVAFLAEVEYIKKNKLFDKVKIDYRK